MTTDPILQQILNHIAILNDEMGQVQISIAVLQTQMTEIQWWFRGISVAILGLLISQAWQVVFMRKNNKK